MGPGENEDRIDIETLPHGVLLLPRTERVNLIREVAGHQCQKES